MNPLRELQGFGQSVWIDYIRRSLIESGKLKRLIDEDGLSGLTSNPKIFMEAISGSDEYDEDIRRILDHNPGVDAKELYEELALADIALAADALRGVYDSTKGADGFVSLEVSPHLAHDTEASIEEDRRLYRRVGRPNVMIKIPATPEGIPAVETLLAEGISINITLMFSIKHYEAVARAHLNAIERLEEPQRVASVASFFVSRIDTAVDRELERIGTDEASSLKGRIAIANAKRVYRRFQEIYTGDDFAALRRRGARPQRVLWGSTSTKNPEYSDVLYVEELIGRETVNTMPPKTLDAFRDHGRVTGETVQQGTDEAEAQIRQLGELGIDLDNVAELVQDEGVRKFAEPFDALMDALEQKTRDLAPETATRSSPNSQRR